ncbi:MAG: single-stranded DNA-binding protein [Planctomycetes bacterium]|nr:single-stranded DNA-binding protein [Planctomycetota bacterium]
MSNLNKVFLIGRLTRDPELRYTPQGIPVSDLGLAVNREYGIGTERRKETLFIDVTVWRKQAELCCQYLKKGNPIFIEGRLSMDSWEGQDGQRRVRYRVIAENFQFLGSSTGARRGEPEGAEGFETTGEEGQELPPSSHAPPASHAPKSPAAAATASPQGRTGGVNDGPQGRTGGVNDGPQRDDYGRNVERNYGSNYRPEKVPADQRNPDPDSASSPISPPLGGGQGGVNDGPEGTEPSPLDPPLRGGAGGVNDGPEGTAVEGGSAPVDDEIPF